MSTAIKLDSALVESARIYASAAQRSIPKQIEHWATIGRIAEQNPELPYDFIVGLLQARAQLRIPRPSGHLFHEHPATDSTVIRPPVPRSSGHP
ncbi:ParD-like antitoxin of type II toxin-antitoxin system [Pseudomonas taetrolens]|uniref:ParD-like antitoxin of type II toxin-antitoxin system n=1 Tax=Pseudomonas taetrolens TaxID=47884 RepID=A0A1H4KPN1_PSETA|nr:hypothetical protein [Pseudomonas taetrolens]SEB60055.1 ParD-like antitoxin of type II toxin-antitoxin system [Pseudomonas taetrolens]VEH47427.1 glycosyltransferase [Pseudomonas taetrolens]